MRALFLLLLLGNLALFGWSYWHEQPHNSAERRIPPPLGELRLLSEIDAPAAPVQADLAAEPQPMAPKQPVPATPASPQVAAEAESKPPKPEQPKDQAEDQTEDPRAQESVAQTGKADTQEPSETKPKATIDATQSTPITVERPMAQVSKPDDKKPETAPEPEPEPETAAQDQRGGSTGSVVRDVDGQCGVFGPIDDRTRVVNILGDLMKRGIAASILEEETPAKPGYWLTTESVANAAEGEFLLGRLERLGFKNLSLDLTEDRRYVVSFGHFKTQDKARDFITRVRDVGFSVRINEQNPGQGIFWIEFPLKTDLRPNTETWTALQGKYQQLGPSQKRCGAVVSQH